MAKQSKKPCVVKWFGPTLDEVRDLGRSDCEKFEITG